MMREFVAQTRAASRGLVRAQTGFGILTAEQVGHLCSQVPAGSVDFLEVFCGCGELTFQARCHHVEVSEGIDRREHSYRLTWSLETAEGQCQLAWLYALGCSPRLCT